MAPDLEPYYDLGLDAHITGRAHRRALMKANGLVEVGSTRMHGAKGTIYSQPGQVAVSVPKSGAYAETR